MLNYCFLGYINESGSLNLARFEKFLAALSEFETEQFRDQLDDIKWFESKTGRRRFGKKAELVSNTKLKIINVLNVSLNLESVDLSSVFISVFLLTNVYVKVKYF